MKIKLLDTLHLSEIRRDAFVAGDKIELPDTSAKSLIERGLAISIQGNPKRGKAKPAGKAAPAVKNKMAVPAKNKGTPRIIGR